MARDIANGDELFKFQTGAGVSSPAATFEVDGEQYIAVMSSGNRIQLSRPETTSGRSSWEARSRLRLRRESRRRFTPNADRSHRRRCVDSDSRQLTVDSCQKIKQSTVDFRFDPAGRA